MSARIPAHLLRAARDRALNQCEYCLLPQESQEAVFHVDHILPRAAGGPTDYENLALACVTCSLRKAARTQVRDPRTQNTVALFHPRRDSWGQHFRWTKTWRLVGMTPTGRATIRALAMNRPRIIKIRQTLASIDLFPWRPS